MADISKIQLPSGGTYNIKDASSIHAPSSPSSGDVLAYNGSAWVASANAGGVFVIHIVGGVPTENYDDIVAAYNAGKAFICIDVSAPNAGDVGAWPVVYMDEWISGKLEFWYRTSSIILEENAEAYEISIWEMKCKKTSDDWFSEGTNYTVPLTGNSYVFVLDSNDLPTEDLGTTLNIIDRDGPMFALKANSGGPDLMQCISYSHTLTSATLRFIEFGYVDEDGLEIIVYTYSVNSNDVWSVSDTYFSIGSDVIYAPDSPSDGDVLVYDGTEGSWVAMAPGVNVYIGTTAPSGATTGTLWLDTSDDESLSTSVSSVEELAGGA